jgi:uncharacterized protein
MMMKILKCIAVILIFQIALFSTSCSDSSAKDKALHFMNKMRAKDYFDDPIQRKLAEAISDGDDEEMLELIRQGADVNAKGKKEMRPLFWAFVKRRVKEFGILLEHGANPNVYDESDKPGWPSASVVEYAAKEESCEYLRLVLAHGGDPNILSANGSARVIDASILHHRIDNIRQLIDAGADISSPYPSGSTPLCDAVKTSSYDVAYLLLENGADPTIKDKYGSTIVYFIHEYGARSIAKGSDRYEGYLKTVAMLKAKGLL